MTPNLNFGEIFLANLNLQRGNEPGKVRPVLIIQNQALLDEHHPSTIIIPLTTNLIDNVEPLRIRIKAKGKLNKDSDLVMDQIRAIDNRRLTGEALCKLSKKDMQHIQLALLVLIDYEPSQATKIS